MDELNVLLTPGNENINWDYSNLNFSEYLVWAENLLKKNRCDLTPETEKTILTANMPFEFQPAQRAQRGILLIHGLLSSPICMHDVGLHFQKQGFLVRGILLPGHGTRPGDLLNVTLKDWIASVQCGLNSLRQEVDEVWMGGLSGGASLALYMALIHSDIRGLFLFAPSLKLKSPLAPFLPAINFVHNKFSRSYWPAIQEENDYAKYRSYPLSLAVEAHKLTRFMRKETSQKPLSCPLWMILADSDETICNKTATQFFLKTSHPESRLINYAAHHYQPPDKRVTYIDSHFPNKNILDFSHACLTFSPENNHYGEYADYLPPLHIPKKAPESMTEYRGALSRYNLNHYRLRRLCYNPDFAPMMKQLTGFMTKAS